MALQKINPTETNSWKQLQAHFNAIKDHKMKDWFAKNTNRANRFLCRLF